MHAQEVHIRAISSKETHFHPKPDERRSPGRRSSLHPGFHPHVHSCCPQTQPPASQQTASFPEVFSRFREKPTPEVKSGTSGTKKRALRKVMGEGSRLPEGTAQPRRRASCTSTLFPNAPFRACADPSITLGANGRGCPGVPLSESPLLLPGALT